MDNENTNIQNEMTSPQISQHAPTATSSQPSNFPKIICIIGMLMGIIVAIYGLVGISEDYISVSRELTPVSEARFGADFYTLIHYATRAASDNVAVVAQNVEDVAHNVGAVINLLNAYSIIPVAIGVFMFLFFALKLCEVNRLSKQN